MTARAWGREFVLGFRQAARDIARGIERPWIHEGLAASAFTMGYRAGYREARG